MTLDPDPLSDQGDPLWRSRAAQLIRSIETSETPAVDETAAVSSGVRRIVRALYVLSAVVVLCSATAVSWVWVRSAREQAEIERKAAAARLPSVEAQRASIRPGRPVVLCGRVEIRDLRDPGQLEVVIDVDVRVPVSCRDDRARAQLERLAALLTKTTGGLLIEVTGTGVTWPDGRPGVDAQRLRRIQKLPPERVRCD